MARTGVTIGFTVAGAVIGGYFGNPMMGAQIGMMVGSIAGALLFPGGEDQKGPRLGDLRVADASYGMPIPIVYGTARVAGIMIWTSGLEERATEQSMKGGGPTSTTYAYYSSFAIGLCEGPLEAVRKIWLDTKLVYDVSQDNQGITNQRLGQVDPRGITDPAEMADKQEEIQAELASVQSALTIYLGTETQLPDPVMEAHEGVGEVPAHRGLVYLLFADLPLAAYGNRIPNVSAEVMAVSARAYPKTIVVPGASLNVDRLVFDEPRQRLWAVHQQVIQEVDALNNTLVRAHTFDGDPDGGQLVAPLGVGVALDQDGALYVALTGTSSNTNRLARLDPVSLAVTHIGRDLITGEQLLIGACLTLAVSQNYVWYTSHGFTHHAYCFLRPQAISPRTGQPVPVMNGAVRVEFDIVDTLLYAMQGMMIAVDRDERAWIICRASGSGINPATRLLVMDVVGSYQVFDLSADIVRGELITYDALTHSLLIGGYATLGGTSRVLRWDIETQSVDASADGVIATGTVRSAWQRGIVGRQLVYAGGLTHLFALDVDTLSVVRDEDVGLPGGWPTGTFHGSVYDPATQSLWVMEDGSGFAKYYLDRLAPGPVTLGSIVEDLSLRAGLEASDVDTSALTAPVHGFVVSQRSEARASVETLLAAFLADGVETDWGIRFQHRAHLPVATLTADDLAAHEPGSTLPDVLTPERLDDQQLPIRLDITYADPARDYQDTVQHARRFQAGQRARSQREVRTPVLLTADQARQLAEQSLSEAWVSRTTYRLTVPYRWSTLDPGDVLEVATGQTALMRVQQIQHGANGILEVTAVAYDRHIYTASLSVGVVADAETRQTITMHAPTALFLLDTHLLRDVDEGSGYYMAMAPQGSGAWSGATAFSSVDGNAWRMEDTLTTAVDYGSATGLLAPGSPYVLDTGHTVDIRMARGSLSSVSLAEILNGANAGLLGDEIVQWQTATALDAMTWRLSNLLRGRRGTEWAIGSHSAGERFIVLTTAALRREAMGLEEVGTARLYRAVTSNTDMFTTTAQSFVNQSLGLKPYSVEHVQGTRNVSNDLTLTWVRRTRLGGVWVDGRDVPLGESQEAYEIDIVLSGTVVRTLTSGGQSVVYLASAQTADGITPGQPVTVTVYQLGLLGRGWPTTATV